jgi:hypothetical protein
MTIAELLERAALAGRQSPPPPDELTTYGHEPVPPTPRCQVCGRRLVFVFASRWVHVPDEPIDPAFDAAFDETYRR